MRLVSNSQIIYLFQPPDVGIEGGMPPYYIHSDKDAGWLMLLQLTPNIPTGSP